jgi:hypothetical protein
MCLVTLAEMKIYQLQPFGLIRNTRTNYVGFIFKDVALLQTIRQTLSGGTQRHSVTPRKT